MEKGTCGGYNTLSMVSKMPYNDEAVISEERRINLDGNKIGRNWQGECLHYEELVKKLNNQCSCYEEEIKSLHDKIAKLKEALKAVL